MKLLNKTLIGFILLMVICLTFVFGFNSHFVNERKILEVTHEHPFYSNGEWVKAKDIHIGDELLTIDGKRARITNISDIEREVEVYNLHVDGRENYFANGILVHNKPDVTYPVTPGYDRYVPYGEELNKIKNSDPNLYNWIMIQRENTGAVAEDIQEFVGEFEKQIFNSEMRMIDNAINSGAASIKLPLAKNRIWLDDVGMDRWTEAHGPNGRPGNDLFSHPNEIYKEVIHKATWKEDVQIAIKIASNRPLPRGEPEIISNVRTVQKNTDGIERTLSWPVKRDTLGRIYIDFYHANFIR